MPFPIYTRIAVNPPPLCERREGVKRNDSGVKSEAGKGEKTERGGRADHGEMAWAISQLPFPPLFVPSLSLSRFTALAHTLKRERGRERRSYGKIYKHRQNLVLLSSRESPAFLHDMH